MNKLVVEIRNSNLKSMNVALLSTSWGGAGTIENLDEGKTIGLGLVEGSLVASDLAVAVEVKCSNVLDGDGVVCKLSWHEIETFVQPRDYPCVALISKNLRLVPASLI